MAIQTIEPVTTQALDEYINQAARTANYENGFGTTGYALSNCSTLVLNLSRGRSGLRLELPFFVFRKMEV